jgi:ubiquinone/menaquinone biosynthesis C-methylase UbiE
MLADSYLMKDHWNKVYNSKEINKLGWYEKTPVPSLKLISKCSVDKHDLILDVGAGSSTLIDFLLDQGYEHIIAVDISEIALKKIKERLGNKKNRLVKWIVDDITQPKYIQNLSNIALWHDRALLHFLLEEQQQQMYLTTLKKVVKRGGYVIIASFSLIGAKMCSGLNVMNYDQKMLSDFLGEDFELIEYFEHIYYMPSGEERPYIYTLFQRKN